MEITENISMVSLKGRRDYWQTLIDYCQNNWPAVFNAFTDVLGEMYAGDKELPACYMMLKDGNIIGFYQLVEQELLIRKDLSPWITCVYIDEQERGQRLIGKLLEHGRTLAGQLGHEKVYLATSHRRLYEKYGFREIGLSKFMWGLPSKIYEHDTIKKGAINTAV
ncbi:MAG: GNAT family N-acetyltransferase [Dehalococcoidales bacterium]|nr:GNAT family N-acetyltransferase [Dehalococcoidales bacterium]